LAAARGERADRPSGGFQAMSFADIADNKWEIESTRPPVFTISGIAQMIMMGFLSLIFVVVVLMALMGIIMPKSQEAAFDFSKPGAAAPAAEAPAAQPAAE
jgi:hypothetical protein